ncbi:MAG: hypothetical protein ACI8Y4_001866 [Candidatus Poriferisodalaceae bacterium]|jgi:hypothetical protein
MSLDPDRQRQLHSLKLRALARDVLNIDITDVTGTPDGAIATDGSVVVALAENRPERGLGAALAAAQRQGLDTMYVFATGATDVLSRRASLFGATATIWEIQGRSANRVVAVGMPIEEQPRPQVSRDILDLLDGAFVDVVVEHGILVGEVEGLEVARVIDDEHGQRLEVGVGAHDREAFAMLHGGLPPSAALRKVVDVVRLHRTPGADPHPLNRLGAERWLRSRIIERPDVVGATVLAPASPPVQRISLKEPVPAVAVGSEADGTAVVLVVSTGIDLDLVPFAADARLKLAPDARLVVAVPERDAHPITRGLINDVLGDVSIVAIDNDWRNWSAPEPVV